MLSGIRHNPRLTEYNLKHNRLTRHGAEQLLSEISTKAKVIDISKNKIENQSVFSLCESVRLKNTPLEKLNLESCQLTDLAVKQLSETFSKFGNIRSLNLSSNQLTSSSGPHLRALIEGNYHLQELYLGWNKLGRD
jgi:hypothetical protein